METARFDQSVQKLAHATGRRGAMRSLGASGLALLAALGLADAPAKGSHKGDQARVQADGKGKKKRKKKRGSASPPGFAFATRVVRSASSPPLQATASSFVSVTAECGAEEKLVSCGYEVGLGAGGNVNATFVQAVTPNDDDGSSCFVSLLRTSEAGAIAGVTIQAVAVCLA